MKDFKKEYIRKVLKVNMTFQPHVLLTDPNKKWVPSVLHNEQMCLRLAVSHDPVGG